MPTEATLTDVFLSYKAEDRPRIAPLVAALEADGVGVWWDARIGAGDDWRATIQRHLDAAQCVIVAWSKRSVGPNGQFVRDEASRAHRRGVYLPVRIDKVDPPLGFGETQALPLIGWKGDRSDPRYRTILAKVRSTLGHAAAAGDSSSHRPAVTRRVIVAGGVAAVAALGVGGWWWSRPAAAAVDSIAVLPFANLSGDPAQAYFSDGMAEELRTSLSRIAGLKVVARTSSEAMRSADAKAAATKLGVGSILTGSVRRSPTMLRVSAQLIDGKDGLERWSQAYDRPLGDSLTIQSDIADHVARALSIRFGGTASVRALSGVTANSTAQDLLLQAEAHLQQNEGEVALDRTLRMVDAALALDPQYGDAVALKARLLAYKAGNYATSAATSQRVYRLAEQTAMNAIEIAPRSRLGYAALADILDQQLRLRAALAQFERALRLPGDDSSTLSSFTVFQSEIGRRDAALSMIDRALVIDPLNPRTYGLKATILGNARRFGDALKVVERQMTLAPNSTWARGFHAYCQMMLGRNDQARAEFDALGDRRIGAAPAYLGALAARQGDTRLVERVLAWMRAKAGDAAYYQFAQIFAQQGKEDQALVALDRAWTARDPGLTMMLVDPLLDPLRADPRFAAMLARLDIP